MSEFVIRACCDFAPAGKVFVDDEHVYTATDMRVGLKNLEPQA